MATDPDTDRVGVGIKNESGDFFLLNGNQALSLIDVVYNEEPQKQR